MLDRLNPMAPGAKWMLRNAPTFWRASFLKIIWYLLLAHVVLTIAGYLAARNITSIPIYAELMVFRYWIWPLAGMFAIGWITSIWNTPLIDRRRLQKVVTVAIYTGFFYGLMTLPNAYFMPVSGAIAKLYGPDNLESDRRALSQAVYELTGERNPKAYGLRASVVRLHVGHHDKDTALDIIRTLKETIRAGQMDSSALLLEMRIYDAENIEKLVQRTEFKGTSRFREELEKNYDHSTTLPSFHLESRFDTAEAAVQISGQQGAMRALHGLFRPATFAVAAIAALLLFLMESYRHVLRSFWQQFDRIPGTGILRFLGTPFRAIDRRLLKNRPKLWQARIHVAVPLAVGAMLFGLFAEELSHAKRIDEARGMGG
ncbi:hypothetical protein GQR58_030615 [Nymphon striatum]|nr:hypothetical protein GQR58_030615 [Nymphon striatum]